MSQVSSNDSQGRTRDFFTLAAICASLVLMAVVEIALVYITPSFAAMFDDLGQKLPAHTQWLIGMSRLAQKPAGIAATVVICGTFVGFLIAGRKRAWRFPLFGTACLSGVAWVVFCVLALFPPLIVTLKNIK